MNLEQDFSLEPLPEEKPLLPESKAAELSFYTAAVSSNNAEEVVNNFQIANSEFTTEGESRAHNVARTRWEQEQDSYSKEFFTQLLEDPNVPSGVKRDALTSYAIGGHISKSLRDKYIENTASAPFGNLESDDETQDELLKTLDSRLMDINFEAIQNDSKEAEVGIKQVVLGSGYVAKDLAAGVLGAVVGGGYTVGDFVWGALQGVFKVDAVAGQELANKVMQWAQSSPDDKGTQKVIDEIYQKLSILEIPYAATVSKVLQLTNNENAAIISGLGFEAILGQQAYKAYKASKKGVLSLKKKVFRPTIPAESPLNTTAATNPPLAGKLGEAVINDTTGQVGKAVGTDTAAVISDMVYPKALIDEEGNSYPNANPLKEEVAKLDEAAALALDYSRWDPTLHDYSKRKSDLDTVTKVISEERTPKYQPQNSVILPSIGDRYIGRAVFGKTDSLPYTSVDSVINAYDNVLKSIPDSDLGKELTIKDLVTHEVYTPDELKATSKYKGTLDDLPSVTEAGIPIVNKPATKTREDGSKVLASTSKNPDGSVKEILIDKEGLKDAFTSKPWTKPKMEGVIPLKRNAFKTPEEYVQFALAREDNKTKYPYKSNPNITRADYENFINERSLDDVFSKKSSAFPSKDVAPRQFVVEWKWDQEYSDLKRLVFGNDAVKTTVFGLDASGLARSAISQHLFGGRGILPRWFSQAGTRAAVRAARHASVYIHTIQKKIANTRYPKQLNAIIDRAEKDFKDSYNPTELSVMFPELSTKAIGELFQTHAYWRRINDYAHALVNEQKRNDLIEEGFIEGLWLNGKFDQAVTTKIKFNDTTQRTPEEVWDPVLGYKVKYTKNWDKLEGEFDIGGKQLARLKNPITDDNGDVFSHILIDGTKARLDILPDRVVPKVPGYSPYKYLTYYFIDEIPDKLMVDGRPIVDPNILKSAYSKVAAVARSKREADRIVSELQRTNPDKVYEARYDREITSGRLIEMQEAHTTLSRHAMKRGERLDAPIEDRLTSLVGTVQGLTRKQAHQTWDTVTKKAFMEAYGKYTSRGEFPTSVEEIQLPSKGSIEDVKQVKNARTIFDQYAKINTFSTVEDRAWGEVFNGVADIFEKWQITEGAAPLSRDLAKQGNLLVEKPKQLASAIFISLNSPRQWIVQPAQLAEMWGKDPLKFPKRISEFMAVRLALVAESDVLKNSGLPFAKYPSKILAMHSSEDLPRLLEAVRMSGIMEQIDLNVLVHGMFNDVDKTLTSSGWKQAWDTVTTLPKAATRVGRSVGFDFAEFNNRLGLLLQAREKWIENNPDGDWSSPEAVEAWSYDADNYAGAMSRAGSYPYQSGALGILMQFGAITQKMTMNLIQSEATNLTKGEIARLTAARAALWGARAGVPFGALIYTLIDQSEDPEVQENAEFLRRGVADRLGNYFFNTISGTEGADLAISRGISPFGEDTTGIPHLEVIRAVMTSIDGSGTNPRFPAIGALGSLYKMKDNMKGWFEAANITGEAPFNRAVLEATYLASGMNNYAKGLTMLGIGDKYTSMGGTMGLDATTGEAFAQVAGVITHREVSHMEALGKEIDKDKQIKEIGKNIYTQLVNQKVKAAKGLDIQERIKMVSNWLAIVKDDYDLTDAEISMVHDEVWRLDGLSAGSTETSLAKFVTKDIDPDNAETQQTINSLRKSKSPEMHKLLDLIEGKGNP